MKQSFPTWLWWHHETDGMRCRIIQVAAVMKIRDEHSPGGTDFHDTLPKILIARLLSMRIKQKNKAHRLLAWGLLSQ